MSDLLWQQPADQPLGIAKLSKLAFDGVDLAPLHSQLLDKYIFEPDNAAALMDLSTIEQLFGNGHDGVARQGEALMLRQVFHSPCEAAKPALRLLALAAPGDVGNNTPLEFLLDGSDIALSTLFIVPGQKLPDPLPGARSRHRHRLRSRRQSRGARRARALAAVLAEAGAEPTRADRRTVARAAA